MQRDEFAIWVTSDRLAEAMNWYGNGNRKANDRPWLTEGFT